MDGLMMDYPLTLNTIMRRAETINGDRQLVTRLPDKSWHRYTYRDMGARAKRLALALGKLGVESGDRVATLCWNHYRHFEAYFGIPACGAVLHTLNLRLHADDLIHIVQEGGDKVLLVDESLIPLLDTFRERVNFEHVIVISDRGSTYEDMLDYETLIAEVDEEDFSYLEIDEKRAASMCYTSGTIGKPKGVVYSHRAITLHTLGGGLTCGVELRESDCLLPAVPMFHVNCWGLPYMAAMLGVKLVFPGPNVDAESLLEAFVQEEVTFTAGVPTVWMGLLDKLDQNPKAYDLSKLRKLLVGGAAVPPSTLRAFQERHNLNIVVVWGMTETTPIGTVSTLNSSQMSDPIDQQFANRSRQGTPVPFVEIRAQGADGLIAWDGQAMGELEVRGPWVIGEYHNRPETENRFTDDGWFRTGDIVSINSLGSIKIEDRAKDLIKSGGEWISSVDLENAIMGHPAVAEAAVVAMAHPKWGERPLAAVVVRDSATVSPDELNEHLRLQVARWWLPDNYEFVDEIPRTATGKFDKVALRKKLGDCLQ